MGKNIPGLIFVCLLLVFQVRGAGTDTPDPQNANPDLDSCLSGAARYCRTLSRRAFHFTCRERVSNTVKTLKIDENYNVFRIDPRKVSWGINQMTRRFVFDYQLIHDRGRIHERRKLLAGDGRADNLEDELVWGKIVSYLNERAVFGPQTLVGMERQARFQYRFREIEEARGVRLMAVDFSPSRGGSEFFESGTLWIDCRDYSVRRIRVVPRHIRGYEKLKIQADRYRTKLVLVCDIFYDRFHEGLYYPSRVVISESYRGGPVMGGTVGLKGFERSRTVYRYDRYRFFKVSTRVEMDSQT